MCALAACVARTSGPCGQKVVMNVTGGGVSEIVGSLVGYIYHSLGLSGQTWNVR